MKKSRNTVSPETVARRFQQALAGFPDPAEQRRRADTKGRLIEALREPLRDAIRQRGCSLPDLVALLRESGLTVHLSTLKRHLGPVGDDRAVYRRARAKRPPPPGRPTAGAVEVLEHCGEPEAPAAANRPEGADAREPARPGAGAVGSSEALARLESALAGTSSGPPSVPPAARPRPDDPPYCPPGTFVPRPELPLEEWYNPSGRTS
jgi:hypothetical protein